MTGSVPVRQPPLLCLATQWSGQNGGHTINRSLAEALARAGHEVFVRVSEGVGEEAGRPPGLTVSGMKEYPGVPLSERANLMRTEGLPESVSCIVGHGRFSSGAAVYLQETRYPAAVRVHVVHALVGSLDIARTRFEPPRVQARGLAESRRHEATETALVAGSDLVVGVGPLLTRYSRELAARCDKPPQVHELIPGVAIHAQPVRAAAEGRVNLLLFGRVEDPIKGTEVTALALRELRERGHEGVTLTLRGAAPSAVRKAARRVSQLAGSPVEVRPFTTDPAELAGDIRAADVVLMPSRNEGYGLVASEAAGHGVPVLVSGCSGFGEFLADPARFPREIGDRCVVSMSGEEPAAHLAQLWADRLEVMIADPPATRGLALGLQQRLATDHTWDRAARDFAAALGRSGPDHGAAAHSALTGLDVSRLGFPGHAGSRPAGAGSSWDPEQPRPTRGGRGTGPHRPPDVAR